MLKKLCEVQTERYRETEVFLKLFQQRLAHGMAVSTEWLEQSLRVTLLEDGRRLLAGLLAQVPVPAQTPQPGQRVYPDRRCEVVSLFGPLILRRDYSHPPGPEGGFPLDQALGLIGGFTPGAARLLARTAAQLPYLESSAQVRELAGLPVDPSPIERLVQLLEPGAQARLPQLAGPPAGSVPPFYVSVDGTGVPRFRPELAGRKGRGPDGQATTREVKLAAFFTQRTTDAQGQPVREPDSSTYLGSFATSDEFGLAVGAAALRRGLAQADTVIYLGGRCRLGVGSGAHLFFARGADSGLLPCQRTRGSAGQSLVCGRRLRPELGGALAGVALRQRTGHAAGRGPRGGGRPARRRGARGTGLLGAQPRADG